MKRIKIETDNIKDWNSFHSYFQELFGFFRGYGRNMNAWIDCMSYLDDPAGGLTKYVLSEGEILILEIENVDSFKKRCPEIYDALIECTAFINHRRIDMDELPILMLSFFMQNNE